MIESFQLPSHKKAITVSVNVPSAAKGTHKTSKVAQDQYQLNNHSLTELSQLLETLGIATVHSQTQNRKKVEPATLVGRGILEELAQKGADEDCQLLVFDSELTSSQIRNIKKITNMEVIDRYYVILEIFAKHAQTREAKIQIEISRLEYTLPRLTAMWSHFSRQKGGIGLRGGEGEQQLELDKRILNNRIETLKKQLETIVTSREEQRKKRKNSVVTAALIGYTNAGKSSLMNRLCKVNVLEEDKLFATLDSTYRTLNPDSHPPMVLIDTVGLISNLPTTLVSGFKSTLESAVEADLLIIVTDIADSHLDTHLAVTQKTIEQLELTHKDKIYIFNKKDKLTDPHKERFLKKAYPNSFFVSSFDQSDIANLRKYIIEFFLSKQPPYDLFVPYEKGHIHSIILAKTNVLKTFNHQNGIFYRMKIPELIFNNLPLKEFILAPQDKQYADFLAFLGQD